MYYYNDPQNDPDFDEDEYCCSHPGKNGCGCCDACIAYEEMMIARRDFVEESSFYEPPRHW